MDKELLASKKITYRNLMNLIELHVNRLKFSVNVAGMMVGLSLTSIIFIFTLTDYTIYSNVLLFLSVSFFSLFIGLSFFSYEIFRLYSAKIKIETMKTDYPAHSQNTFLVNAILVKEWNQIKEDNVLMGNLRKVIWSIGILTLFLGILQLMVFFLSLILIFVFIGIAVFLVMILMFTQKDIKLNELAEKQDIAMNSATYSNTLKHLAKDDDASVRRLVASNENTPAETLAMLAKDKDRFVRLNVARNKHVPPRSLECLANDEDRYTRLEVYHNKNTPENIREYLKEKLFPSID